MTNKSYLSIVEDRNDENLFVVRARIQGDIEEFFDNPNIRVIESEDRDYRFRVFADKKLVKDKLLEKLNNIDYSNFKNSVESEERKRWYTRIWSVMFDVQEDLYGQQKWWEQYYNAKNFPRTFIRK